MYDNIHHLIMSQTGDNKTNNPWSLRDQIYLCVKDDNSMRNYSCSPYDSFEQADAYYKQNFVSTDGPRPSTMVSISKIWPKAMISHILQYKLADSFINVRKNV